VIDVRQRSKSAFVLQDLLVLGMTMSEIDDLPQCVTVPMFRGPAAALGWMYVAERPMLASAVIRRHLATRLPSEMACASSFLSCYAGRVGTMWRELGEAMDRLAAGTALAERLVSSAQEAFRTLHRWRTSDLQRAAIAS
jgi:heme oxygenase (biliverdin-IX-beta and delta-forming)